MGSILVSTEQGSLTFKATEYGGCLFVHLEDPELYRGILLPSWINKAQMCNGFVKLRHDLERMGRKCPAHHLRAVFKRLKRDVAKKRPHRERGIRELGICVKRRKC